MTLAPLPVTEWDLLAYVDGRLDALRRAEVERHLRESPEDRERVEADIVIQGGLRLLFEPAGAGRRARRPSVRSLGAVLAVALMALVFVGAACLR